MRGRRDRVSTQAILDQAAAHPWFEHIYLSRTFSDPSESRWAKEIQHNPLQTVAGITVPALIMFGTDDPWVPAQISIDQFRLHIENRPNLQIHVVNGANHEMATTISPKDEIDPALFDRFRPDAPEYFAVLTMWLTSHVILADRRKGPQ
jgi:uncharacterized protein